MTLDWVQLGIRLDHLIVLDTQKNWSYFPSNDPKIFSNIVAYIVLFSKLFSSAS